MHVDDVRGALEDLKGVDLSERRLVVVDLLEGDGDRVGSASGSVDVGVGAGPHPILDLVFRDDLRAGVDAPGF